MGDIITVGFTMPSPLHYISRSVMGINSTYLTSPFYQYLFFLRSLTFSYLSFPFLPFLFFFFFSFFFPFFLSYLSILLFSFSIFSFHPHALYSPFFLLFSFLQFISYPNISFSPSSPPPIYCFCLLFILICF